MCHCPIEFKEWKVEVTKDKVIVLRLCKSCGDTYETIVLDGAKKEKVMHA
jgi:hypothetical protein